MIIFEKPGKGNTAATLRMAVERAQRMDAKLVVASTGGDTAVQALRQCEEAGCLGRLIVVASVFGSKEKGTWEMRGECRSELQQKGVPVVVASHVLSGVERGLSKRFSGVYPAELIAHTLRMLGQGVKVCVECSIMALDAGLLTYGKPVVAVGGTGHGADTAAIVTPGHAADVLETQVHEILCKPY